MDIMDTYKINLMSSGLGGKTFEYDLGDDFFTEIGGLIQRGNIHTTVSCLSAGVAFKFQIHSVGTIVVPCDRCLSDLELRIETMDELNVKLGQEYADEGDCVVVSEAEGFIDLAQFIYEFIALGMPISCCHEPGKCDETMMQELSRHQSTRSGVEDGGLENSTQDVTSGISEGEDSVELADVRWSALQQLKDKL